MCAGMQDRDRERQREVYIDTERERERERENTQERNRDSERLVLALVCCGICSLFCREENCHKQPPFLFSLSEIHTHTHTHTHKHTIQSIYCRKKVMVPTLIFL